MKESLSTQTNKQTNKQISVGRGQFVLDHHMTMTATYTLEAYLTKRTNEGISIKKSESFLQEDLNKFVGGRVTRSDVQILRRGLVKMGGTKQLLGSPCQSEVLSKLRTCERRNAPALNGRAEVAGKKQKILIQTKKVQPTFVRKKDFENLTQKGKAKRIAKLRSSLHDSEVKELKSKSVKVSAFQALCFQKDAHMSERDMDRTQKLVKKQVGAKVLASRWLKKRAVDQTVPNGIVCTDFKVYVTLQAGLNKTVERLLKSTQIPTEKKTILKSEKVGTMYVKSGQDGTTGKQTKKKLCSKGSYHVCKICSHFVNPKNSRFPSSMRDQMFTQTTSSFVFLFAFCTFAHAYWRETTYL